MVSLDSNPSGFLNKVAGSALKSLICASVPESVRLLFYASSECLPVGATTVILWPDGMVIMTYSEGPRVTVGVCSDNSVNSPLVMLCSEEGFVLFFRARVARYFSFLWICLGN